MVAAVVSHRGELAGELIDLIENFTGRYKANLRVVGDIDGLTPSQGAARYRDDFKASIFVALVRGWGQQISSTGINRVRAPARR